MIGEFPSFPGLVFHTAPARPHAAAFWWGCQEVNKTHNFGVPRNHLPTIPKNVESDHVLSCAVAFPEGFFFFRNLEPPHRE